MGKALKGRRDDVVLATKVHGPMGDDPNQQATRGAGSSRRSRTACGACRPTGSTSTRSTARDPDIDIDETLGALSDLVHQGKVMYIGCSTFPGSQIVEAHWARERRGHVHFMTEQPPYSILVRGIESEVLPVCRALRHGGHPLEPAGGRLPVGTLAPGRRAAVEQAHRHPSQALRPVPAGEPAQAGGGLRADRLADEAGLSLIELALAFVIRHPAVTAAIIGPRTMEHLESQLAAVDVTLTDDVLDRIDEIVPPGVNINPADGGWPQNPWLQPGRGAARRRSYDGERRRVKHGLRALRWGGGHGGSSHYRDGLRCLA